MIRVWDKEDRVWLDRDNVDAGDMLRLHPDRYSRSENKPDVIEQVAAEGSDQKPVKPGKKAKAS